MTPVYNVQKEWDCSRFPLNQLGSCRWSGERPQLEFVKVFTVKKAAKIISNLVYSVGVVIFVTLVLLYIFGANYVPFPNNMLPLSLREIAFEYAAFGAIPMIAACIAVYRFNDVKKSSHKKRNTIIIFFPGVVCGICLLFIAGIILLMIVKAILHVSA